MKISELIKLYGLPVKVKNDSWDNDQWFEIISHTRGNGYPGYLNGTVANVMSDGYGEWELYVEPKPKKKLYAYLVRNHGLRSYNISYEESEKIDLHGPRLPQFDCEI